MSKTFVSLAAGDFVQDWSNADLITANDDWSGVAGIVGYRGDDVTSTVNADARTLTGPDNGPVNVIANQANPNTLTTGGVAEFQIADPTVALQGSGTADAPNLVLYLDATGRSHVHVEADIRDIDGSADNAAQQLNVQYRLGDTGNWVNVPGGYIADATTGPSVATAVTHLSLDLPGDADGQSQVEVRFITVNATGSDEWVGIDNIHVSSQAGGAVDTTPPTLVSSTPGDSATGVDAAANVTLTFSEPVYAGSGDLVLTGDDGDTRTIAIGDTSQVSISGGQVTINPTDDLHAGDTYHLSIASGVLQDVAGNAYAGTADDPIDFTTVDPAVLTPIYTIQGEGHTSAYAGAHVSTSGVVTAIDTTGAKGFWIQDPTGDGDPNTSDGIFVFTNGAAGVTVGQLVQVDGTVTEYSGGANNLTTTEINSPTVHVLGTGTVTPVVLGEGGDHIPTQVIDNDNFTVFDPSQDGIDFFEAHEGELVTIHNAVAVDSTYQGATWVLADGGADATGVNSRGGITISADDFNPERVQVYVDSGVLPGVTPDYAMGQSLGDVTGVISYYNGEYELLPVSIGNTAAAAPLPDETTTIAGAADRLTFGEYNVENLDPTDPKFDALAHDIVANLGGPDIISLEEIQDADGAGNGSDLSGATTLNKLIAAIAAAGGPHYAYVEIAPTVAGSTGGEPGGNIRNAFLYNVDRVDYVAGSARLIADDDPTNGDAFYHSRMPLAADFAFNGETVTAISVHDYARSGSDELFGATQPPVNSGDQIRIDQDAALHRYILGLQAADPNAKILVGGDFNGFQFEPSLTELTSDGSLTNLDTLLAPVERYSTEFEGLSQQIDHILVSQTLATGAQFDIVHLNTGQPVSANSPSDHDPTISAVGVATVAHVTTGAAGDDQLYGGAGNDKFFGGDGNDLLRGHDGNDSLYGGAGSDTLDGGPGVDQMQGGIGDDVYVVDSPFDQAFEKAGEGTDTVQTTLSSYTLGSNLENLTFTGSGAFTGAGNTLNNVITGGDGNDVLDGGRGADTLYGGAGNDTFTVDNGGDVVFGGSGGADRVIVLNSDFHLNANSSVEIMVAGGTQGIALYGSAGNEHLIGNDAANAIYGGGGKDALDGMGGDDSLYVTLSGRDEVTIDGGAGSDLLVLSTLDGSVPQTFYVDGVTASGYSGGMGDGYNGASFTDVDRFQVTTGDLDDSLDFSLVATRVVADAAGGDDRILGGSAGDSLTGGAGNDTLDGRGGADTLIGGDGNDSLIVDNTNDRVFGGAGDDTVTVGAASYHLNAGASVETLIAGGTTAVALYGAEGDEHLVGNAAANLLDGGAGADTLEGGAGDDTYILRSLAQHIVEQAGGGYDTVKTALAGYALDDNLEALTYTGTGAFAGSGNALNNVITGGAGNDSLDGDIGADTLIGGAGDDVYYVDDQGDRVIEQPGTGGGHDQVITTLSVYTLAPNVEDLFYNGSSTFLGTGNALNNVINADLATAATLHGGGGDDVLIGSQGDDSLYGEGGRDSVYGGDGDDYIRTLAGDGPDTIDGGFGTDLLSMDRSADAEAFSIDLTRTGEQMTAGDGGSIMNIEQLRFTGGAGADSIVGGGLDDVLKGGAGNDTLSAGAGNDILEGGAGQNLVTGGAGADTFRFDSPTLGNDTVSDFETGIDHVALSKAGFGIVTLADFDIVDAATGPTEGKATLIVDTVNHSLNWDADGTGSAAATLFAHGAFTTSAADYMVF